MDTEGRTTTGATDGADEADQQRAGSGGRPVRVSYVPQGFGVALVVDDDPEATADDAVAESGLLRVSDAVVTLEIPRPDGGRSVLSWDPAEVAFDPRVA